MFQILPANEAHTWIDLEGPSSHDFCQRLFSRDLRALKSGQAVLCCFLSAEGRVQHLFWSLRTDEGMRLLVRSKDAQGLYDSVERYHFGEAFVTQWGEEVRGYWAPMTVGASIDANQSPNAGLIKDGFGQLSDGTFEGVWRGTRFRFENSDGGIRETGDSQAWTRYRIEKLIPSFGEDYDAKTLVFEVGLDEICDSNKGCYVGQEVVERVRSRSGQAARIFVRFEFEGEVHSGDEVFLESGEAVARITTSAEFDKSRERNSKWGALGFVKRSMALGSSGERLGISVRTGSGVRGFIFGGR